MRKSWADLSVLAVSPISLYEGFNTSIHRIRALRSLGCHIEVIDSSFADLGRSTKLLRRASNRLFNFGFPVSLIGGSPLRQALINQSRSKKWDILWLEKALDIEKNTLKTIKEYCPNSSVVGFSADDMYARHNQSQQFLKSLPFYDFYITTKSYNVDELKQLGCRQPVFMNNGYDPDSFKPILPTETEKTSLGGDIGFIGTYENDRADMLSCLASSGFSVRVWGGSWEKYRRVHQNLTLEQKPLLGKSFAKACRAFKINLNFLRKCNRDLQTTRSIEIPACGGFMLAERSKEHQKLFKEGEEAEFFSSKEELRDKCAYYLKNDSAREQIAQAGYERCLQSGYSNAEQIKKALEPLVMQTT